MRIQISNSQLFSPSNNSCLEQVEINDELFNRIVNPDSMPPFLMAITSSSNCWMYISSRGGLTAGRTDPNQALFPYTTDDKLHDAGSTTGPKTIIRLHQDNAITLWEPFSDQYKGLYRITQSIYKNTLGSKVIFEEENHDLSITFRYQWYSSEAYGWVRKAEVLNTGSQSVTLDLLDGLQNVMPYGVDRNMQSSMSTLVDAYKRTEIVKGHNLALFRLSSIPVDRAEPSEALRVNAVWHHGLPNAQHLLSAQQIHEFRAGGTLNPEDETKGVRGCMLTFATLSVPNGSAKEWYHVANLGQDAVAVMSIARQLRKGGDLVERLNNDAAQGNGELLGMVQKADGIQVTNDTLNDQRHTANVLFNIMRGGTLIDGYTVPLRSYIEHLQRLNVKVWSYHAHRINALPQSIPLTKLIEIVKVIGCKHLYRLTLEFLPLTFGRRHGDPSRPWNVFSIANKDSSGERRVGYQGNWRDIFQNWEALAFSYPIYLPSMIARFLNASTADGYNPYRVTSPGFDWEVMNPTDPWSNIGYWGDHQVIYLLKLLEMYSRYNPAGLLEWLNEPIFAYANLPYRLKSYKEILADPNSTIAFDQHLHEQLVQSALSLGVDAKLIKVKSDVLMVTLAEKMLVTLLTKLSNFIPGAGIWLNTQRPEWNDANNALVGYGASVVTLCHIRRYITFLANLFAPVPSGSVDISIEVGNLFYTIRKILKDNASILSNEDDQATRRTVMDALGNAGSDYREAVYAGLSGSNIAIPHREILAMLELTLKYVDHSILSNRRHDGLYHAYNLMEHTPNGVEITRLPLMLEGQVAVLDSGLCSPNETISIVEALLSSDLWCPIRRSFILYPNKELPKFLDLNVIPKSLVRSSELLSKLLDDKDSSIITQDCEGNYHFNAKLRNASCLAGAFSKMPTEYQRLTRKEAHKILSIYEEVFNHKLFLGRSGSFFKYEGLGCVYWHMVSKLLLCIGESILALAPSNSHRDITKLKEYYFRVREGIGVHKSPKEYGAFPTDPYSHTPSFIGAQQPGMTGQVKEDVLNRFNELGVVVSNGTIIINPVIIRESEFLGDTTDRKELSFTVAGVPFTYTLADKSSVEIVLDDTNTKKFNQLQIPKELANHIFQRTGVVERVVVRLERGMVSS